MGARWCLSHRESWLTISFFSRRGEGNRLAAARDQKITMVPAEVCPFVEAVSHVRL